MALTRDELIDLKQILSHYMITDIMDLNHETYMNDTVIQIASRIAVCNSITKKIDSMIEQKTNTIF